MQNKNPLKELKPGSFVSIMNERLNRFKKNSTSEIPSEYPVNTLARRLHPNKQNLIIKQVTEHSPDCKTFTLVPDTSSGTTELAYFSAGQYITVFLEINGLKVTRAYSLSSAPKESLGGEKGFYEITVKAVNQGLVSSYIIENWQAGTKVQVSAPEGNFDYVYLRDAPTVVGIAGGSGITPFLSMAKSICYGDEDFNFILLYGSRNAGNILFKQEFDQLMAKSDKIKVVHVLSNQEEQLGGINAGDFEQGFITAQLIQKYAQKYANSSDYSVFLCGPQAMYNFMDAELQKLNLEQKYIRHEMFGEIHGAKNQQDYPGCEQTQVEITVTVCDTTTTVKGNPDDTILQILEKGGIAVPNRCRSGECGWCHTLLKSGQIFIPKKLDFRRQADLQYGYIHPCCTFALSNLELDIPPAK